MFKSFLLLACILVLADLSFSLRHNSSSSSFNLLSMSDDSDVYSDWAEYHKKTEAKLDSVLAKCYECIEKKSGYQEHTGEAAKFFNLFLNILKLKHKHSN